MNLFELFAKVSLDTTEYEKEVGNATKSGESLGSKLKSGLATAGGIAAKGIGLIAGAATAAGGALLALEANTEEYRVAQGKLNTAFEAAGYSTESAKQAYTDFYKILGDTDTATEASQLLAKLADNEKDLSTWTNIAAGVAGTFGDSLPIEGLIESANETAKVGQVTGSLADALNWAGISEDEFNTKLAACSSESERNKLIMDTLSGTYDDAADAFYRNNEAIIAAREAQSKMDESLGKLGESVSNVKTRLMGEFLPGIAAVAEGLAGMLSGTEGAEEQFSTAIGGLINTAVASLPEFLNFGIQILSSILMGIVQNIPTLVTAIPQIIQSLVVAFQTMWPTIQTVGIQLLTMLGNGILTYVPQLVAQLPTVIMAILNFLTQNLPQFIQKGTEFIVNLTNGIMQQIPGMVAQLPQIISAFMSFIAANLPQILQSGIQILLSLASGIISSIPDLVAKLPEIISAIVNGIMNLLSRVYDVGKEIVSSIGDGFSSVVSNALQWGKDLIDNFIGGLKSKWNDLKNAASSLASTVRDFIGFSEPKEGPLSNFHTYAPDMIDLFVRGIHENSKKIKDAFDKNFYPGEMDFGSASVDFASSGLGVSSAGIVNGLSNAQQSGGTYTFNLVLPDGTKLASYMLKPLADYARANGTPILNPT